MLDCEVESAIRETAVADGDAVDGDNELEQAQDPLDATSDAEVTHDIAL